MSKSKNQIKLKTQNQKIFSHLNFGFYLIFELCYLDLFFISALLVRTFFFSFYLIHYRRSAFFAHLSGGLVPQGKIAGGISTAAIKNPPSFRFSFENIALFAFRTLDARFFSD